MAKAKEEITLNQSIAEKVMRKRLEKSLKISKYNEIMDKANELKEAVKSGKDGSAEEKLENFKDLFSPSYGISTARKSDAWKDEYFSVFTDFMRRENTEKITYEEILRAFQKKDELKKKMRIFICKQNAPHTKSRKADS